MANGGSSFISGRFIVECIKTHPNLSFAQEREIIEGGKYSEEEIRKLLFMHNIRLAVLLSNKYWSRTYDKDDGLQKALIGLWKAAQQFDYSRGWKFSTYCVPKILGEVTYDMRTNDWKMDSICISMDKQIGDSEDGSFTVADILDKIKRHDADTGNCESDMKGLLEGVDLAQTIFSHVDKLSDKICTDKQKAIFKAYFAADNFTKSVNVFREVPSYSYEEIGDIFGCTRENVRQSIAKVISVLRMRLAAQGILRELQATLGYKLEFNNKEKQPPPSKKKVDGYDEYHATPDSANVRYSGGYDDDLDYGFEEDEKEVGISANRLSNVPQTPSGNGGLKGVRLRSFSGSVTTNWERFACIKRNPSRVARREARISIHFRPERGGFYSEETRRYFEAKRRMHLARAKIASDKAERFRAALMRREANIGVHCAVQSACPKEAELSESEKMRNTMCEAVEAGINGDSAPTITDFELARIDSSLVPNPDGVDDGSNDYECEE